MRASLLCLALAATPLAAQAPAGWSIRPDEGTATEVKVATMAPGWHITTGPAAILYKDADKATGSYEFSAKLHLFPDAKGHLEAFGIFIGGQDLAGAKQKYTYFVIRGDGTWKIKRRNGAATSDVTPGWTASPAIVPAKGDGSVANVLSVVVRGGKASFQVNGKEVYSAEAKTLDTDGTPGLRINHNLSIHAEAIGIKVGS